MDRPVTSTEAQEGSESIAAELALVPGATDGRMMGMPTLYLGGKAFAGLFGDAMVFKLEGTMHGVALDLPGAALFDPSGMGRPMKAWVRVPLEQASQWAILAASAAEGIGNPR